MVNINSFTVICPDVHTAQVMYKRTAYSIPFILYNELTNSFTVICPDVHTVQVMNKRTAYSVLFISIQLSVYCSGIDMVFCPTVRVHTAQVNVLCTTWSCSVQCKVYCLLFAVSSVQCTMQCVLLFQIYLSLSGRTQYTVHTSKVKCICSSSKAHCVLLIYIYLSRCKDSPGQVHIFFCTYSIYFTDFVTDLLFSVYWSFTFMYPSGCKQFVWMEGLRLLSNNNKINNIYM